MTKTRRKITKNEQLKIIVGLTILYEDGRKTHKTAEHIIEDIYKIAHLNGTCKNEHLDWHKEGKQWLKDLKGII